MVGSFPLTECKFYKAVLCGGGRGCSTEPLNRRVARASSKTGRKPGSGCHRLMQTNVTLSSRSISELLYRRASAAKVPTSSEEKTEE